MYTRMCGFLVSGQPHRHQCPDREGIDRAPERAAPGPDLLPPGRGTEDRPGLAQRRQVSHSQFRKQCFLEQNNCIQSSEYCSRQS